MMKLSLFAAATVSVANAALIANVPKEAAKENVDDVTKLSSKLEKMVGGLNKVIGNSANDSKIASTLSPWVKQVSAVLKEVKTNSNEKTHDANLKKLKDAQASVQELMVGIAAQGSALIKDSQEEKQGLLMGVLLSREKREMSEQYKVLEDGEFKSLDAVKYVDSKRGLDDRPLVEQVGEFLDKSESEKAELLKHVDENQEKSSKKMAEVSKEEAEKLKMVKALEAKVNAMKDEALALAKQTLDIEKARKDKKMTAEEIKAGAEGRHAATEKLMADIKVVQGAMKAMNSEKKADAKKAEAVTEKVKEAAEKTKKEKKQFLMLLQTGLGDCPYCKAQCFEKCHKEGHTYMNCMRTCADVGN